MADLQPAGWHPDPEQPNTWRFWDGARWTDQRSPMQVGAPVAVRQQASDGLVVGGYLTAFLLPLIGFIIGVILMARDRAAHGVAVVLLSMLAFWVIWPLIVLGAPFLLAGSGS